MSNVINLVQWCADNRSKLSDKADNHSLDIRSKVFDAERNKVSEVKATPELVSHYEVVKNAAGQTKLIKRKASR